MMTEENQGAWPDDRYTLMPKGNLWIDHPHYWREIPAAEWEKGAEFLTDLMPLADHTTVALTVALGDAVDRTMEEARRAREREATPEEQRTRLGLSPEEDERLLWLLNRSDAVNNAYTYVLDHAPESSPIRARTLEDLEKLGEELNEEFYRYRGELGVRPRWQT